MTAYHQGESAVEDQHPLRSWQQLLDDAAVADMGRALKLDQRVYGFHLLRYAQAPGSREIVPMDSSQIVPTPAQAIKEQPVRARLDLRLKRPLVTQVREQLRESQRSGPEEPFAIFDSGGDSQANMNVSNEATSRWCRRVPDTSTEAKAALA